MPSSTKLDEKLEGVENLFSWKYRIVIILEENYLVQFIKDNVNVLELEGNEAKEKYKKDMIRAKRIITYSIKDHVIP
jgi:hypothetical protein